MTGLAYPAGVCFGAVMHRRLSPVEHRFVYPTATLRLPLSALDALHVPWLGIDRPHVFSFRSADHGPGDGSPLLPWLRQVLARHGVASVCDGEVVLRDPEKDTAGHFEELNTLPLVSMEDSGMDPREVLNLRIEAKMAHARLLTRASFARDARDARTAQRMAAQYVAACRSLLLS